MTQELSTVQSWLQEQAKAHAEPEWLRQMRERAWEAFQNAPVVRLEKTDLSRRTWDVVPPAVAAVAETGAEAGQLIQSLTEQSDAYVYVRDGQVVQVRVPADWSETGVIVADLHSAAQQHADLVQQYLGQVVSVEESKWSALNAAVWQSGLFVYVPRRVSVPGTVHYVVEDTGSGVGIAPRALVIADAESRLAFAEVHISSGDKPSGPVRSHVLEVIAKSGAQVTVVTNHAFHAGPTNFSTSRARVENDASVDWVFTDVGDGFTVGIVESDLVGSGSRSTVRALGLGYGRQHLDLTASMLHRGKYSISDIVMHGVLRGRANSIYRSSTHIFKHAVGAGSEQHDRMLVLDGTARADAIPMLLIDENDVQRCGHAASVGRIDESQIYYLMSRGISKSEAMRMIIWGHLQPTVDAIPSEAVRTLVRSRVDEELSE